MPHPFLIVDVFTDSVFGGNQLAVVPDARGIDPERMQAIAREFNFSESTFVLPPDDPAHTCRVRIFTPRAEVPFAGHPNIGTAFALALDGKLRPAAGEDRTHLRFEEAAGVVEIEVTFAGARPLAAELVAPQALAIGDELDPADVGLAISVHVDDVVGTRHRPTIVSVGLPFVCVELPDAETLARAYPLAEHFARILPRDRAAGVLAYVRAEDSLDARVFAPLHGVTEDPASGSGAAALAGLLASLDEAPAGDYRLSVSQGRAIERPSRIETRVTKRDGRVTEIRVGGGAALVARGTLEG